MCQAIAARRRRRPRRPSCSRGHFLPAVLATLLLLGVCDGYMSTMHLGRTLKALRARELEQERQQQQQQQQQQQDQGQDQEHGSLPPEAPASSPAPDQRDDAEEIQEDSWARAFGTVRPHPSWGAAPEDSTGVQPTDTQGEATSIPNDNGPAVVDGEAGGRRDGVAGEGVGSLGDGGQGRKSELPSTSPATAAAVAGAAGLASAGHDTADAAARTAGSPGEGKEEPGRSGSKAARLNLAGEDNDEVSNGTGTDNTAGVAVASAAAGERGVLDAGRSSGSSSSSGGDIIPADHHTAATEVQVGLADGLSSSSISSTGAAAGASGVSAAATPARRPEEEGEVEEEEEAAAEEEETEYPEEEEVVEDEDVEAAAIREILSQRTARDAKVQAAAARAVEALPETQRECFEEVKAFAFGGVGDGKEEGLSEEDVAALETVAICGDRDGVVLAFLRHSKFDVRKAKESMRRCCAWRRENEADDIFRRAVSPAKMRKHRTHWPTGFHKRDRAGRPVFYDRVGQSDLAKLRAEPDGLDQDEMVQIFTQNMEARRRFVLTRLSREAGHPVDQMTTVLDLTGLGMRHMSKEAVSYTRRISDVFQDNYSGMTCSLLILNAPWVFSKGWQVIEGFLSEDTVAKVKVLGKGDAGLAQLEKYIPKENIPEFLGGESPAIIGPSDPLWVDVDGAVRSWASGGDPFLDQAEVNRVSGRIRREREKKAMRASKSKAKAESKVGEQLRREEEGEVGEEGGQFAPAVGQELAKSGTAAAGADAAEGRRARVRAPRRAAAAVAAGAGSRATSQGRRSGGGSSGRRGKSRRQLADTDNTKGAKLSREDSEKDKEGRPKKRHRRQRSGLVHSSSSSSSPAIAAGRPSHSSSRRRASTPLPPSKPSAPTKAVTAGTASRGDVGVGTAARTKGSPPERGSILRGPAGDRKDRGSRSRKKRVTWEDEEEEIEETEEEEQDDDGKAMAEKGFGERVLEGLGGGVVPVLRAWVSQLVVGLLAAARILLSAAETLFRLLRDAFFEQVDVEY